MFDLRPSDEELDALYGQVLAGFTEDPIPEPSSSTAQSLAHHRITGDSRSSGTNKSFTAGSSRLPDSQFMQMPFAASKFSTQQRTSPVRRLPPVPGSTSTSEPPTPSTVGMPEARPCREPLQERTRQNSLRHASPETTNVPFISLEANGPRGSASPERPPSFARLAGQEASESEGAADDMYFNDFNPALLYHHALTAYLPPPPLNAPLPNEGSQPGAPSNDYSNFHFNEPTPTSSAVSGYNNTTYSTSVTSYNTHADTVYSRSSSSTATTLNQRRSGPPLASSILSHRGALDLHNEIMQIAQEHIEEYVGGGDSGDDEWEEYDRSFADFSLLSHIAMRLRDKIPRETHAKGSIPYPRSFTGQDIVSTIHSLEEELLFEHGISTHDRRVALQIARSLQNQLFFYEVEWGERVLSDEAEDVYMFLDDREGDSDAQLEMEELPTGVITLLTKCYSSSCGDGAPCYAYSCPRKNESMPITNTPLVESPIQKVVSSRRDSVPWEILASYPENEVRRQKIIHTVVTREQQYIRDLDLIESIYIHPLRNNKPPVVPAAGLEDFIAEVFGNILELRGCSQRLLESIHLRQTEQGEVISTIGDIFLEAAKGFRLAYPTYTGHFPTSEKTMKEQMEHSAEFRLFVEQCSRHPDNTHKLDLKHFLNRPSQHLQQYPILLEAIQKETAEGNPDRDFLFEAIQNIKNLQVFSQLRTFQSAMGKGPTGKLEWYDLVSTDVMNKIPKKVAKRQAIIFELISGEMSYFKDLENIEFMYVRSLRAMDPPIIPVDRLNSFIYDVYHNFGELYAHHRKLLERLHEIQKQEHPFIRSITAAVYDAVLNFRDAYLEYIQNYPIAAYRIEEEMDNNPRFKDFVDQCVRHPDAHRLDMKSFINRPIPRLLRYELLLKSILEETPEGHDDILAIPAVLDLIKSLGKDSEPGVVSAKQKVELWRYNSNLVFKPGEVFDLDLLHENRSLIHSGKLLRQPDTGFGWTELFVILLDNYLVITRPKDNKESVTKYHVYRRPIPLDLISMATFNDPPAQRGSGLISFRGKSGASGNADANSELTSSGSVSPETVNDARSVYPCTFHHNGRLGGLWTVYAETAQVRLEWQAKLEEAMGLRKVVQESNKVFEVETLSSDTFSAPSLLSNAASPSWNDDNPFTGKVTCSVPFTTSNGRGLVAMGCAEGVWIGFIHDSRSMRRVLHLKMVTQCAILEEFGIFLVLADKSLFAYHIEALVPSSHGTHVSQTPQKLSGHKDVQWFSVGKFGGRTLVIYMKKKGLESLFRALEPLIEKINEETKPALSIGSRFGLRSQRSEWFRVYRDFFLPCETFDLFFLKASIVILCTKGFEVMDLNNFSFKSITLPIREDSRFGEIGKRCESCQPLGMFRSGPREFLLCYTEFGLYVDKHGYQCRKIGTVEWEGTAERAVYHPPYVLLFDTRFIEIRQIETGQLVQIISGEDVRCLWDGRGANNASTLMTLGPDGGWIESVSQQPCVHAVMNVESSQPGRTQGTLMQHIFELNPTVPLYLPELNNEPPNSFLSRSSSPLSPGPNASFSSR